MSGDTTLIQLTSDQIEEAISTISTALNTAGLKPTPTNVLAMVVLACEMGAQMALPRNMVKEIIDAFLGPAEDDDADSRYAVIAAPKGDPLPTVVLPMSGKKLTH